MLSNEFYQAVIDGDDRGISRAIDALFPSLVTYLKSTMGYCDDDCQESVQLTLIQTIDRIKKGVIREPSSLNSYMMTTAKNNLLRSLRRGPIEVYDESASYSATVENQTDTLFEFELQQALWECVEKLDPKNREFMKYWINNPGIRHEEVAEMFGLSINATWQRKFRLIKILQRCAKKKGF